MMVQCGIEVNNPLGARVELVGDCVSGIEFGGERVLERELGGSSSSCCNVMLLSEEDLLSPESTRCAACIQEPTKMELRRF